MPQLIAVIVAIAIMAIIFTGGSSYLSVNKYTELEIKNNVTNGYQSLRQGQMLYREHTDSLLPTSNWETAFEKYAFVPQDIQDLTWVYNKNGYGNYFCLTGNTTKKVLYSGILSAGKSQSKNSFYINSDCGSTLDFVITPDFSTNPKISATFYFK